MGVKGASNLLYSTKELSLKGLKDVARSRLSHSQNACCIDVDCSWVGLRLLSKSSSRDPLKAERLTAEFLVLLKNAGFVATPVCDPPDFRHHSKRASIERIATRERKRISGLVSRYKATQTSQLLASSNVTLTVEERCRLQHELTELNKEVKSFERSSMFVGLPASFIDDLHRHLNEMGAHSKNEHNCYVAPITVGSFQADSVIAKRAVDGKSQLILANDTDFFCMVGPKCIAVRDFVVRRGRGRHGAHPELVQFEVSCCALSTHESIFSVLSDEEKNLVKRKVPPYPLFDKMDHVLRASVSIILGCDVLIGGIKTIGAAKLWEKVKQLREENLEHKILRDRIVEWACTTRKGNSKVMTAQVFDVFVKALLFEPANSRDSYDAGNNILYVHSSEQHPLPEIFPRYLEDFCRVAEDTSTKISDALPTRKCVGPLGERLAAHGGGEHTVLEAENISKCDSCGANVCSTCQVTYLKVKKDDDDENVPLCMSCFASLSLVPLGMTRGDKNKTIQQMLKEIIDGGFELSLDAEPAEIEEIYDRLCIRKELAVFKDSNGKDMVPFPVLPASAIDKLVEAKRMKDRSSNFLDDFPQIRFLLDFSFSEGGQFINDPSLPATLLPKVLRLFATFLEYSPDSKIYTKFDHKVYHTLPSAFIEWANGARNDSGFHLLRRCVRHTMDTKASDISLTDGVLFLFTEDDTVEPGILLNNIIPASMKNNNYNTCGAFTHNKIVASKCSCICGAEGGESLVDVHILPLALQLSLLLFGGLAEHILLELSARIHNTDIDNVFADSDIASMKKSILILMEAAGQQNLGANASFFETKTISEVLSFFSVGTERRKKKALGPPDPSKVGPVKNLVDSSFKSVEQKVKELISNRDSQEAAPHKVLCHPVSQSGPKQDIILHKMNGCYEPVSCGFCNSGIPTRHRCKNEQWDSTFIDPDKGCICGIPFCVKCQEKWQSEDQTLCGIHLGRKESTDMLHKNMSYTNCCEESSLKDNGVSRRPDYLRIVALLHAIGVSVDDSVEDIKTIGLKLTLLRAKKEQMKVLEEKGMTCLAMMLTQADKQWKMLLSMSKKRLAPTRGAGRPKRQSTFAKPKSTSVASSATSLSPRRTRSMANAPTVKKPPKRNPKQKTKYCCFPRCESTNKDFNVTFHRLQTPPKVPHNDASTSVWKTYHILQTKRKEQLDACGMSRTDERVDLRVCSRHEKVEKRFKNVRFTQPNGTTHSHSFSVFVPCPSGMKTESKTMSKGLGYDRRIVKMIEEVNDKINDDNGNTKKTHNVEALQWAMTAQRMCKENTSEKDKLAMNRTVSHAIGLNEPTHNVGTNKNRTGKTWFSCQRA